jgi:hypothetical protein
MSYTFLLATNPMLQPEGQTPVIICISPVTAHIEVYSDQNGKGYVHKYRGKVYRLVVAHLWSNIKQFTPGTTEVAKMPTDAEIEAIKRTVITRSWHWYKSVIDTECIL